ncbi:MAG: DUF58 domain-containing protein, partial [Gammaproteobacteria bacterium]|nr:DUF58 domain-containing protein [Gammaproteobacteria bacterium]
MPIRFLPVLTIGNPVATAEDRVAPQLADLMALARRAAALPAWTRAVHVRQRGDYRAPLKGRGMEYAESRPYQAGDDVRALDWRLTARLGKPHTKLFQEERERPVYVCVDARANMAFATRGVFKSVQASRAAALLAWKAIQNGDRVGGIVFTEEVHHELVPSRGSLAAARLFKTLVANPATADDLRITKTESNPIRTAIGRLGRLVKTGSLVFIITDGRHLTEAAHAEIVGLARHNDVGLLVVYDEFEANLPMLNTAMKLTSKRAEYVLPATTVELARAYPDRHAQNQAKLSKICR